MPSLRQALHPTRHPGFDPSRRPPAIAVRPAPEWAGLAAAELPAEVDAQLLHRAVRAGTALGPLGTLLLVGLPAALIVLAAVVAIPRAGAPVLRRRQLARRDGQLADALERVATGVRAGHSIGAALQDVTTELADPLGRELQAVTASVRHGAGLSEALDAWAAEPTSSREVVLAAAALALGVQAGGRVARALDGVAATLRERRQLQAEVRALATQARASAWLLALAPLGFAGLMSTVEPGAVAFLFTTPVGLGCLTAGVALDVIGMVWMARVIGRAA
jgi:tight adherence protein B